MALSDQTSFRLIGGGGVRGASGGAERVLSPDPALDFFAAALRRHRSGADVVAAPDALWSTDPRSAHAPGLLAHLLGASDERIAGLSDLLLVLSAEDWARAAAARGPAFGRDVGALLGRRFADWTAQVGLSRRHPERPLQVRLLCDGGEPMGGERLGLRPGEFVTGLLPNLYAGPGAGSRALLAVHLNVPGQWTGYREVARLYDDQDLLTLGAHWLDSARVPALGAPALYRLRFDEDDGLVHLLGPELGPGWRLVRHGDGEGPTIFAIEPPSGEVLAWLVLEVLGPPPRPKPATVVVVSEPTLDQAPSLAARVTLDGPTTRVPLRARDEAPLDEAPLEEATARARFIRPGAAEGALPTAAPQAAPGVGLGLREVGLLLQRVHFPDVMQGYEVYVDGAGRTSTFLDSPAATLRVIGQRVALVAHKVGLQLDGAALSPGQGRELSGDHELRLPQARLGLRDLRGVAAEGWPYLYALRVDGALTHALHGDRLQIGRDPACRLRLPDDPHNDNILWRPEALDGAVVRARGGAVPKARFATDSIMVAKQHVEVEVGAAGGALGRVRNVAEHCAAWLRVGGLVQTLSRRSRPTGPVEAPLVAGAEIFVGNTVFEVIAGEPAVDPLASGATLAPTPSMIDGPVLDALPPPPPPPPPPAPRAPAAALAPAIARGLEPLPSLSELGVDAGLAAPAALSSPSGALSSPSGALSSPPAQLPAPVVPVPATPAPVVEVPATPAVEVPARPAAWPRAAAPSPVARPAGPGPTPGSPFSAGPPAPPIGPRSGGAGGGPPPAPSPWGAPAPRPAAPPVVPVAAPPVVAAAAPPDVAAAAPPVVAVAAPPLVPDPAAPPDPTWAAVDAQAVPSADQAWSAFSETGLGSESAFDPLDAPEPTTLKRSFTYDSAPTRRGGA
jgi:hypothetical protein